MTEPVANKDEVEAEGAPPNGETPSPDATEQQDASEDGIGAAAAEGVEELSAEADGSASVGDDDAQSELESLRAEYETLNDRHLRLAAEFNNFRRRSEQERLSAWARAQADLVAKFLDVLDDLHRVADLDLSNATVEAIMEGIDLVERKFVRTLEDSQAVVIDPVGDPFDPELMEAMMRVPAESDDQVDTVAQVFQKGYSLQGVLVRPARVSVYTSS